VKTFLLVLPGKLQLSFIIESAHFSFQNWFFSNLSRTPVLAADSEPRVGTAEAKLM